MSVDNMEEGYSPEQVGELCDRAKLRGLKIRRRRMVVQAVALAVVIAAVVVPFVSLRNGPPPKGGEPLQALAGGSKPKSDFATAPYPKELGCGVNAAGSTGTVNPVDVQQVSYVHPRGAASPIALVLVKCVSGSSTPSSLYAFEDAQGSNKPHLLEVLLAPPRLGSTAIWYATHFSISDNEVQLPLRGVSGSAALCCPNISGTGIWQWNGTKFQQIGSLSPEALGRQAALRAQAEAAAQAAAQAHLKEAEASAPCSSNEVNITLKQGPTGAGNFNLILLVTNSSHHACELNGYPMVDFFNSTQEPAGTAIQAPNGGSPLHTPVMLQSGAAASALLSGSDMPHYGATTCPSYTTFTVTLPNSKATKTLGEPVEDCASLSVSAFVAGFNGVSSSGEIVGTAPTCKRSTSSSSRPGPVVQVNAWSGKKLANFVTIFTSEHSRQPYQLVLTPGRYRMVSAHTNSQQVVVRAGKIINLGLFGGCSIPLTNLNIPGHGGAATTTIP